MYVAKNKKIPPPLPHPPPKTNKQPGDKVLDVGCGVGGPLREIALFSGAHVTGLNNNSYQISRALYHNTRTGHGITDTCCFVKVIGGGAVRAFLIEVDSPLYVCCLHSPQSMQLASHSPLAPCGMQNSLSPPL
jgi:SAM-dependent methyltransferase